MAQIDLTESFGEVKFSNRTLVFKFIVIDRFSYNDTF